MARPVSEDRELALQLAGALEVLLYDLHPAHGNTAHHGGGYGGSMVVQCCHVDTHVATPAEQLLAEELRMLLYRAGEVLGGGAVQSSAAGLKRCADAEASASR